MKRLLLPAALGSLLAASLSFAAIPSEVRIDTGTIAGPTGGPGGPAGPASPPTDEGCGAGLPSWSAYGEAGKAQVLGDVVVTESGPTPEPAKLAFFDAAYQQQMKGGDIQ